MAARAQAGRTATRQRRRPAARRRRPAARSGASRVNWDRVGRIALTLVLAAVLYSYLNPAIDFVRTYTATTAAKAQQHELQRENTRLHQRIQSTDDPIVVERMARAQGMVAEGETPVTVRGLGN
ncbi:MAG TPA: septum formation initiator family protein [Solirubrobacterales bacterium]|nr:septum formation initiator family protein [Solirubrobacterales bacterium]